MVYELTARRRRHARAHRTDMRVGLIRRYEIVECTAPRVPHDGCNSPGSNLFLTCSHAAPRRRTCERLSLAVRSSRCDFDRFDAVCRREGSRRAKFFPFPPSRMYICFPFNLPLRFSPIYRCARFAPGGAIVARRILCGEKHV